MNASINKSDEEGRLIMSDWSGETNMVVGASRGLGRTIATAFAEAGGPVVACPAREEDRP